MRSAANYTIRISSAIRTLALATVLVSQAATGLSAAEDYGTWPYVTNWELNTSGSGANIADTLLNVPVLITLDPATFGGFANTLAFGADIRFARADGGHLEYQIERWIDGGSDKDTAEIWVLVDTLFGYQAGQIVKMHYGKSGTSDSSDGAAVFDSAAGHAGAWHLNEWLTGSGFDSIYADAANGLWGDDLLSTSYRPFYVGLGQEFAGTAGECIRVRPSPALGSIDTLVLSAWFRLSGYGGGSQGRIMEKNGSFALYADGTDTALVFEANRWNTTTGSWRTPLGGVQEYIWYHVAVVYDYSSVDNDPQVFLNGVNQAVTELSVPSGSPTADSDTLYIGNRAAGDRPLQGWLDEVRIGRGSRPQSWFKLAYENQRPAQTLVVQPLPFTPFLTAMPDMDSSIALSWDITGLDTVQYDSVGIWYRDDYPPDSVSQAGNVLLNVYGTADSADTAYGLDPDSMYYFGLFFRDTAGTWSDTAMAAFDSSMTAGAGAGGSTFIMATAEGDSSAALWWSILGVDTAMYDSMGIWYRQGDGIPDSVNEPGNLFLGYYAFSDTADTVYGLMPDSMYYFGLFLRDTLGYWTDYMEAAYDSVLAGMMTGGAYLLSVPVADSTVMLWWNLAGVDTALYDSAGVWYRYGMYADSATDPQLVSVGTYAVTDTMDTLYGLEPDSLHYFSLFLKDTLGYWTNYMLTARDTARPQAPAPMTWLAALPLQDSVVMLQWDVSQLDIMAYDSIGIWYRYGTWPDSAADPSAYAVGTYALYDTADTAYGLEPDSLHYFALYARDTSGTWDILPVGRDSAYAQTAGPQLVIRNRVDKNVTCPGDTLTYTIYYDNDGNGPTGDSVSIQQLLPYYVTFDSGSVGGLHHTGETGMQVKYSSHANIAAMDRDSLWAVANPGSVAGIKWIFSQPVGADDADDSSGIADDSGDVDAGFVRFRVIVK